MRTRTAARIIFAVNLLLALAATAYALLLRAMGGVEFHDFNLRLFEDVLTRPQGDAIVATAQMQVTRVVALLVLTNAAWLAGTLAVLLLTRPHPQPVPASAPGGA